MTLSRSLTRPLARALPITLTPSQGVGATNPVLAALAKGADGFWLGGLTANYFQDVAGTISADTATDPIGRVDDRSSFGRNGLQPSSLARPLLQFDNGFPVAVMDALDDGWSTGAAPGTGDFTFLAVIEPTTSKGFIMQSRTPGQNDRAYLLLNSGGFTITVGSNNYSVSAAITGVKTALGFSYKSGQVTGWLNSSLVSGPSTPTLPAGATHIDVSSGGQGPGFGGNLFHAVASSGYGFTAEEMAEISSYLLEN